MEEIIKKNNAFFRQLLFLALLITIGLIISKQLGFFLGSFLGAITIYIVLRNVMFKMTEQYGWRRWLASLVLVLAVLVVLGAFGYLMIHLIASEVTNVNFGGLFDRFNDWISETGNKLGITIMPKDILDKSEGILTGFASGARNTTYSFAANIFMMLIILYFMLTAGHRMDAKVLE